MRNGFEKGNTIGRPRNAKNKLARKVIEDLARIWDEPILPNSTITRGEAAMRVMSKEHPDQFVKAYVSLVPREMILSDPSTADLTDEQIDEFLIELRQRRLISAPVIAPTDGELLT